MFGCPGFALTRACPGLGQWLDAQGLPSRGLVQGLFYSTVVHVVPSIEIHLALWNYMCDCPGFALKRACPGLVEWMDAQGLPSKGIAQGLS